MFASTGINVENLNLLTEVHNHSALDNWRIFEVALFGHKKRLEKSGGVLLLRKCGGKKVIDTKKTNLLPGSD